METRASYVMVGTFVVVCVIALFVAMLWVAGAQYREEYTYYRTYFNGPVTGLGKGTTVRYNGIDAGRVTELAFDQANPKLVIVTLELDPTLRLHVDSVASMESQGLTGATYLEIAGGTANSPFLRAEPGQEYPVIPSRPSTLQQLAQSGPELVANLNIAGQRFSDLLNEENRKAISETLEHLRSTSSLIDDHAEDLDRTLASMRAATDSLNRTLTNVDHSLASVDQAVGSFQTTAETTNVTVQKVGQLSDQANKLVGDTNKLVGDTDKVINGQSVAQFTQLMAEARALVASITRLSNDLEKQPTKLLFGDQRQGYTPK
jgi:phospholipid/cholesterol/gamma-HCH transport system substrate-binding protein